MSRAQEQPATLAYRQGFPAPSEFVCTGCGLLCDDLATLSPGQSTGCTAADRWLAPEEPPVHAVIDGHPTDHAAALTAAAGRLHGSRRVLITGLASASLEAIGLACRIAERLQAAIDTGSAETALLTGPTIARVGEVTAAWEELRDRADLVVFWSTDPTESHPRFLERFVLPSLPSGTRRTLSLGPAAVLPPSTTHTHQALAPGLATALARQVQRVVEQQTVEPCDPALHEATLVIHAAFSAASCIGIVSNTVADTSGLTAWSIAHLVRTLAHRKPAFQIPLGAGIDAGGGNTAGAAAALTWRYGAAGAIATANRDGGLFLPAEANAVRLITRGEVDCVLIVGRPSRDVEQALANAPVRPTVLLITDRMTSAAAGLKTVLVPCASLARGVSGTMLREDGRPVRLQAAELTDAPTLAGTLDSLTRRLDAIPEGSS